VAGPDIGADGRADDGSGDIALDIGGDSGGVIPVDWPCAGVLGRAVDTVAAAGVFRMLMEAALGDEAGVGCRLVLTLCAGVGLSDVADVELAPKPAGVGGRWVVAPPGVNGSDTELEPPSTGAGVGGRDGELPPDAPGVNGRDAELPPPVVGVAPSLAGVTTEVVVDPPGPGVMGSRTRLVEPVGLAVVGAPRGPGVPPWTMITVVPLDGPLPAGGVADVWLTATFAGCGCGVGVCGRGGVGRVD
jgi:hypothetical protein